MRHFANLAFGVTAVTLTSCSGQTRAADAPGSREESAAEIAIALAPIEEMTGDEAAALTEDAGRESAAGHAAAEEGPLDDGATFDVVASTDLADDDARPCATTPDRCKTVPAPILVWGLHPRASNALRKLRVSPDRVTQTSANTPVSGGFHEQDGTYAGKPYAAATDLSTRGLTSTQIKHLLESLGRRGFAAWYREPGHDGWPASAPPHVHAVYANAYMKSSLRAQVKAWLAGSNGLATAAPYGFYAWSGAAKSAVRAKLRASGGGAHN